MERIIIYELYDNGTKQIYSEDQIKYMLETIEMSLSEMVSSQQIIIIRSTMDRDEFNNLPDFGGY